MDNASAVGVSTRASRVLTLLAGLFFFFATLPTGAQVVIPGPTIGYTGGFTLDDPDNNLRTIPGVFTWKSAVHVEGSGWRPFENLHLFIDGPLNAPWASSTRRQVMKTIVGGTIAEFPTDSQGNLLPASFRLPYTIGDDVLSPGLYRIFATRLNAETVLDQAYSATFNLSPDTIVNNNGVIGPNWGFERGARDGFLGDNSPERTDPEWITVWSRHPVGMYATVAATNDNGANQAVHITYHDYPWTHYGHDLNLHLVPDNDYRWVLATANYKGSVEGREFGRIEWEWETQNNGSPSVGSYGHGVIGVPLFVTPTVGDRVYTVGAWVLDNGHPDEGDRAEIHPPRLLATMRHNHTAVPFGDGASACKTRASQVDIYVSGHGGGLNHYYDELERMLDNDGAGGARIRQFMPGAGNYSSVYRVYQQVGPESTIGPVDDLLDVLGFLGAVPDIHAYAGPSALFTDASGQAGLSGLPWAKGPELRPINDMDYEFDVPLPPPPAGATHPLVKTTQYPLHTTQVNEVITYVNPDLDTGLPTAAHIKIPYASSQGDNGMYARSFNFYWDTYSAPGRHYVVRMDSITSSKSHFSQSSFDYYLGPQPLYLWTEVNGQWKFLSDMDTAFILPNLTTTPGVDTVDNLGQATFDAYLDPSESLRVFTHGYAQRDLDYLFGNQGGLNAYDAGIQVAVAALLGSGDNQDIGGALFEVPLSQGSPEGPQTADSDRGGGVNTVNGAFPNVPEPIFSTNFTVTHVPSPPHAQIDGRTNLGGVCLGATAATELLVQNAGELPLDITGFSISGAGYSILPNPDAPYTLPGGEYAKLTVVFSPTAVEQGAGTLTVTSGDPCVPVLQVPLTARVIHSTLSATPAQTVFPPTMAACGSSQTTVSVANTGDCELVIDGASMDSNSYSVNAGALPLRIAPGATATLTVTFAPKAVGHAVPGTLTLRSNDPLHPTTTISFCGEGLPTGIRVIALRANGTPYPLVDQITVTGGPSKTNVNANSVPLATPGPPLSCTPLQYHLQSVLAPTSPSGSGSSYELKVKIGSTTKRLTFTLRNCEFKPITVQFP